MGLKIIMFLPTEAKKSLPATKQKLWQTTLTTVFHQQTKYGANSPEAQHHLRKPKNTDFFVVSSPQDKLKIFVINTLCNYVKTFFA